MMFQKNEKLSGIVGKIWNISIFPENIQKMSQNSVMIADHSGFMKTFTVTVR